MVVAQKLPIVIITPSTPLSVCSAFSDEIPLATSQLSPHLNHLLPPSVNRPRIDKVYSTPLRSSKHLFPPLHTPLSQSKIRHQRSSLYSIILVLIGLTLVASSVICTSDQAEFLLEVERNWLKRLSGIGRGFQTQFDWSCSIWKMAEVHGVLLGMENQAGGERTDQGEKTVYRENVHVEAGSKPRVIDKISDTPNEQRVFSAEDKV
ncbi:hypothetical protein L204_101863 [Cryptococcus depauperatus]|nr:hypothetical protein L204_05513 [Cryptococcus depauperatus CBS 7855]